MARSKSDLPFRILKRKQPDSWYLYVLVDVRYEDYTDKLNKLAGTYPANFGEPTSPRVLLHAFSKDPVKAPQYLTTAQARWNSRLYLDTSFIW